MWWLRCVTNLRTKIVDGASVFFRIDVCQSGVDDPGRNPCGRAGKPQVVNQDLTIWPEEPNFPSLPNGYIRQEHVKLEKNGEF